MTDPPDLPRGGGDGGGQLSIPKTLTQQGIADTLKMWREAVPVQIRPCLYPYNSVQQLHTFSTLDPIAEKWLSDLAALEGLGTALARVAQPGSVLLLAGELGSGKTTLTQAIARGLGILDPVTSPTFILMQRYDEGRIPLIHADLYRLSHADPDELELWDPDSLSVIEWPDRLQTLPEQWLRLEILILPDQSRRVQASGVGGYWQRVKNELESMG